MLCTWPMGSGGAAFILSLAPAAWFRFGQGITVTGSGVSQWDDVSGNARHLLQGTDAARPPKQGDGSILFNGTSHFLRTTFTHNQPCTHYLLARQVTWTANDHVFDGSGATCNMTQRNGGVSPQFENFAAGSPGGTNSDWTLNVYAPVAVVFNGAASLNQVGVNAPVAAVLGATNPGGMTLGTDMGATAFSNIQVKEIILYPGAHDAATRARVIAYLSGL